MSLLIAELGLSLAFLILYKCCEEIIKASYCSAKTFYAFKSTQQLNMSLSIS